MAAKIGPRCKACWHMDCADCTRWTERDSICRHRCDVAPRQMELPLVTVDRVTPPPGRD